MSFEIFKEEAVKEEVRLMLIQLKKADYAISTLPKEVILEQAIAFNTPVNLRKLKDNKVKVTL